MAAFHSQCHEDRWSLFGRSMMTIPWQEETIAGAALGLDHAFVVAAVQFFTQVANVNVKIVDFGFPNRFPKRNGADAGT